MSLDDLRYLQALIRERSGIVQGDDKQYLIHSRLAEVWRSAGLASLSELVARVRRDPHSALAQRIVDALATHETSFFRDLRPFQMLQHDVIPALIKARESQRQLRIWCAAAASGQEPYSLLMLLADHFPQLAGWRVDVLASDLSRTMLERARQGVYTQYEVNRGLPARCLVDHFERLPSGDWQVSPALRRALRLEQINLIGSWPLAGPIDLLLARNVLIYFDGPTKARVLDGFHGVLADDGYLFLGGAETTLHLHDGFAVHKTEHGICFTPV
jgi:chemotaxis protein methyltransferase CheR